MTVAQHAIIIATVAVATMLTRFAPFLIFGEKRNTPPYLSYLGRALPPAVFGMLVVYCLKSVSLTASPYGLPELISIALVVLLHLVFRRMLLSIGVGTLTYILLLNFVFV